MRGGWTRLVRPSDSTTEKPVEASVREPWTTQAPSPNGLGVVVAIAQRVDHDLEDPERV